MALSQIETASLSSGLVAPTATALTTASGSAPSYSARAWVNFNGTGTVAIRASGNVSSITDVNVGSYILNFTAALVDTSFAVAGSAGSQVGNGVDNGVTSLGNRTTANLTFYTRNVQSSGGVADYDSVNVAIFR